MLDTSLMAFHHRLLELLAKINYSKLTKCWAKC